PLERRPASSISFPFGSPPGSRRSSGSTPVARRSRDCPRGRRSEAIEILAPRPARRPPGFFELPRPFSRSASSARACDACIGHLSRRDRREKHDRRKKSVSQGLRENDLIALHYDKFTLLSFQR